MAVQQDIRSQLEQEGMAGAGVWGGPQKQTYYTPSGDRVLAIPSIHEWVQKDPTGKVIAQGLRDANLDKGWTLTPPTKLKVHCKGCDKWHDTKREVQSCIRVRALQAKRFEVRALRQFGHSKSAETVQPQIEALTGQVA